MSGVLAVAEHRQGQLRAVSHEVVSAGQDLATALDATLHVAVIGAEAEAFATRLDRRGVETIYVVPHGERFNHDIYALAIQQLIERIDTEVVVTPHSVAGLDYAPAVATREGMPLVTDVTAVTVSDGQLLATRELYGSKVETELAVTDRPCLLTVRDGAWDPATGDGGDAEIRQVTLDIGDDLGSTVTGYEPSTAGDAGLRTAEFVIGVGRGIEDADNVALVEQLCEATGATLGASRPVIDNGWLPKARQIGQSGITVDADVYVAIGISGAIHHVSGIRNAGTIIAINEDPDAPIFDVADYGIVGDLFEVVPELLELLR